MQFKTNLINLWSIKSKKIYVKLDNKFREKLFFKIIKKYSNLNNFSKITKINYGTILSYKSGKNRLPLRKLKLFMDLSNMDLKSVDIKDIGMGANITYKALLLPHKVSPELCRVAGYLCGDGGLNLNRGCRPYYANKEKVLINDLKKCMFTLFKTNPYEQFRNNAFLISYDSLIGLILWSLFGSMCKENKKVPKMILKANKKLKTYFIKALFDDEAHVRVKEHKIEIKMANKNLINALKNMLNGLKIKTNEIKEHSYYKNKKSLKNQYRLIIYGRKNIETYSKKIGFNHPIKKQSLIKSIKSYKFTHYYKVDYLKIIPSLLNKNKEMTMYEIAKKIGRKPHCQLNKILMWLIKEGNINVRKGWRGIKIYSIKK